MDTTTSQQKPTDTTCTGPNCGQCLKGGMPMKKEVMSLFLILFIITTTIVGVLYINAKRELKAIDARNAHPAGEVLEKKAASPVVYPSAKARTYTNTVALPKPLTDGKFSLEKAIATRRTRREFSSTPVTLAEISQMAWSGQGQTDPSGKRTAPSARESYSMTLFVFIKEANGLTPGVYEYLPKQHALGALSPVDMTDTMKTAGAQAGAQAAPVVFLIASDFGMYQAKTKSVDVYATYMEAGHISQNMYLQAESMGMATVSMAGFSSPQMVKTLKLDPAFTVQYLMPFGHRVVATNSAKIAE